MNTDDLRYQDLGTYRGFYIEHRQHQSWERWMVSSVHDRDLGILTYAHSVDEAQAFIDSWIEHYGH